MRFKSKEDVRMAWENLRRDTNAFSASVFVGVLVAAMIAILVGYILVPVISNQEYIAANNASTKLIPGATGLLPLGPLMYILAVVVLAVVAVLYVLKQAE